MHRQFRIPFVLASLVVLPTLASAQTHQVAISVPAQATSDARRDSSKQILTSLYVATAVMQGLDVHSTYRALSRGAAEANPITAPLTLHRATFVAAKAGITFTTIYATRRLAERHRITAIITLAAINTIYAVVVTRNYRAGR